MTKNFSDIRPIVPGWLITNPGLFAHYEPISFIYMKVFSFNDIYIPSNRGITGHYLGLILIIYKNVIFVGLSIFSAFRVSL